MNNISHYPEQRHEERNDERRKRRGEQIQQCNMRVTGIPEGFFLLKRKEKIKKHTHTPKKMKEML